MSVECRNEWMNKNKELGQEEFKFYRDEEANERKGGKMYTEGTTFLLGKETVTLAREFTVCW